MGVEVDGHAHAGMTKPLLRDLWMHALLQHVSGMAVAQVMQPNPLQAALPNELGEGMGERARL